ncbi:MAG: SpoIIE family protein phosphatase [Crocinitomicaceae bacterium]|jgi:sigma-B regulation protein RsbU (phosphoserine phosphatase)|nr:SpoIIE family protein phosphatase [Crocinitomicaceae bacterium]MDB4494026.1 SpoIIE family protein phosphatase [Flavobacteriales bacterium]
MAHSIERLEQRLELQDYKLSALLDVTQGINDRASEEELLDKFRASLAEHLGIHRLVLYAFDGSWRCLLANGIDGDVPEVQDEAFFEQKGEVFLSSTSGAEQFDVVIPVLHNDKPLAYLLAGDTQEGQGVSPVVKHLNFIQTLTNVLVVALQNQRLELERASQEATRRELELAATMQSMLVPTEWPEDRDMDVAAFYKPHLEVGGDYYDVFAVDEDRMVFCMADVSGKGIAAAFLMSNFQANLRASFQYEPDDLTSVVNRLNERVSENAKGEKYITVFAAVYHRKKRELQYVNCGHNPPLIMLADGKTQQLELGSVGLGMFREIPSLETGVVQLDRDSTLVCFTDGLVEQENEEGVPYGMQRMEEILRERRGMPVKDVQTALIDSVKNFKGEEPSFDDTALMVVRFH